MTRLFDGRNGRNVVNALTASMRKSQRHLFMPRFLICAMSNFSWILRLNWGTFETNLLTNEGFTRNERLNACQMLSIKHNTSLPLIFTFCGKYDVNVGWSEKIAFYDSVNYTNHGGFHFWSSTDH